MVMQGGKPVNHPSFCDCKYGWENGIVGHSEYNGCPEMRNIHLLLSKMTDDEYIKIIRRE